MPTKATEGEFDYRQGFNEMLSDDDGDDETAADLLKKGGLQ